MQTQLNPCYRCGATPRVCVPTDTDGFAIHVRCRCGLQLYGAKRHFGSEQEAIEAWNTRAGEGAGASGAGARLEDIQRRLAARGVIDVKLTIERGASVDEAALHAAEFLSAYLEGRYEPAAPIGDSVLPGDAAARNAGVAVAGSEAAADAGDEDEPSKVFRQGLAALRRALALKDPMCSPPDSCTCDGASYDPNQGHPFIVNRGCPVHAGPPPAAAQQIDALARGIYEAHCQQYVGTSLWPLPAWGASAHAREHWTRITTCVFGPSGQWRAFMRGTFDPPNAMAANAVAQSADEGHRAGGHRGPECAYGDSGLELPPLGGPSDHDAGGGA